MRFGVDQPELDADVVFGVSAPLPFGVGCFMAECLGGDDGDVDEECLAFVKSREMEAVAVDVPASAAGAGVRGRKAGGRRRGGSGGGGCSSRILRRLCIVRVTVPPSEEDSSVGGVIERGSVVMICLGVSEHEERHTDEESLLIRLQSADLWEG